MDHNKGKSATTSVPSIAIRFHANAEELEELYCSDQEHGDAEQNISLSGSGKEESEGSPLRNYLPKLIKRSASTDTSPALPQDSSPPSDPWRFFADIKGKITKSVEDKLTEIKARKEEEGSPRKQSKDKDNSSQSDTEDLSESSISRTCGAVSTTEGVEMSSDDESPEITPEFKNEQKPKISKVGSMGLRHRFRLLKNKTPSREGVLRSKDIKSLCSINGITTDDVESGVDALEDLNGTGYTQQDGEKDILRAMADTYDNIDVDEDTTINVKDVSGIDLRSMFLANEAPCTVFAPTGFVDFRKQEEQDSNSKKKLIGLLFYILLYCVIQFYSVFFGGIMIGGTVVFALVAIYDRVFDVKDTDRRSSVIIPSNKNILEIPAVKEYQPMAKFEGWVNEYPDTYNPHTYHISQTQSVYLRLQGNLLRVSHCRSKIPKRAMWNEPHIQPHFTYHRIYNLLGAGITLLPEGLTKKRHWSKKYPICITLNKDQFNFDYSSIKNGDDSDSIAKKGSNGQIRKGTLMQAQRFSKLTEEEEILDFDFESSMSPSPELDENQGNSTMEKLLEEELQKEDDEDLCSLPEDWATDIAEDSNNQIHLYFFGRTDREKEDWFRRLMKATHRGAHLDPNLETELTESVSDTLVNAATLEMDYTKFMAQLTKVDFMRRYLIDLLPQTKKSKKKDKDPQDNESLFDKGATFDTLWLNALIGRVLFDCMRDENICQKIKERIQRKLSAIKLPYFIEELLIKELTLGNTSPLIKQVSVPVLDERGLWIDLEMTYEGLVVLTLQTNLNLMKLKQPQQNSKPMEDKPLAMYNSEVDDSAESSSNDEFVPVAPPTSNPLDATGTPIQGLGGTSNASKKFIKMVDKIAESKFFQAATEYKYIKNLMEGVSNTDLRLKVEIKGISGTIVLNIPPPPSDRVWIGFRPVPKIQLSAHPIVGERNITMLRIMTWIEKRLLQEFQKVMVIPNMEDLIIPVMCPKLPE